MRIIHILQIIIWTNTIMYIRESSAYVLFKNFVFEFYSTRKMGFRLIDHFYYTYVLVLEIVCKPRQLSVRLKKFGRDQKLRVTATAVLCVVSYPNILSVKLRGNLSLKFSHRAEGFIDLRYLTVHWFFLFTFFILTFDFCYSVLQLQSIRRLIKLYNYD